MTNKSIYEHFDLKNSADKTFQTSVNISLKYKVYIRMKYGNLRKFIETKVNEETNINQFVKNQTQKQNAPPQPETEAGRNESTQNNKTETNNESSNENKNA